MEKHEIKNKIKNLTVTFLPVYFSNPDSSKHSHSHIHTKVKKKNRDTIYYTDSKAKRGRRSWSPAEFKQANQEHMRPE